MIKYNGFIDIEGDYYNINAILSIKKWNFDRQQSVITFINGNQKTVSEGLHSLMMRVDEVMK